MCMLVAEEENQPVTEGIAASLTLEPPQQQSFGTGDWIEYKETKWVK